MNLALFDFDGTITTGDTWTPFMRSFRESGWRSDAFGGQQANVVRRCGSDYATSVLPAMVRDVVLERIAWHKAQVDRVVVVSASLNVYLHPWCDALGVDCM